MYYVEMTHDCGNGIRVGHATPSWRPYATEAAAKKAAMGYAKRDNSICVLAVCWTAEIGPDCVVFRRERDNEGHWGAWIRLSYSD